MNFSILILGAPFSSQSAYTAYRFTEALLKTQNRILRVFFYEDAVHCGTRLASPPNDEFDIHQAWQALAKEHNIELIVCIAAAARRGIISEDEARRHAKDSDNLQSGFELSGLGQLVEAIATSDRLITFGA